METLEPRQVERPLHWRWLGGALRLMLQSPWRFGILIALLACIDTSAAKHLQGLAVPQILFEWAGLACLPLVWTLVSALARGAENGGQTSTVLLDFVRNLTWCRSLFAGVLLLSLIAALKSLANTVPHKVIDPLPGELLSSFAAQCYVCWAVYGLCYYPLLLFMPRLSGRRLWTLSKKAERLNDTLPFWLVLCLGNILALVIEKLLSYGIAAAAWLVYSGIVSYVAYKEIFERPPLRLTRPVAAAVGEAAAARYRCGSPGLIPIALLMTTSMWSKSRSSARAFWPAKIR